MAEHILIVDESGVISSAFGNISFPDVIINNARISELNCIIQNLTDNYVNVGTSVSGTTAFAHLTFAGEEAGSASGLAHYNAGRGSQYVASGSIELTSGEDYRNALLNVLYWDQDGVLHTTTNFAAEIGPHLATSGVLIAGAVSVGAEGEIVTSAGLSYRAINALQDVYLALATKGPVFGNGFGYAVDGVSGIRINPGQIKEITQTLIVGGFASGDGDQFRDKYGNFFSAVDVNGYCDGAGNELPMSGGSYKQDLVYVELDGTYRYERSMGGNPEYTTAQDAINDFQGVAMPLQSGVSALSLPICKVIVKKGEIIGFINLRGLPSSNFTDT